MAFLSLPQGHGCHKSLIPRLKYGQALMSQENLVVFN